MLLELGVIVTGGALNCAQPDTRGSLLKYSLAERTTKNDMLGLNELLSTQAKILVQL